MKKIVIFSGAGLDAESGIETFRGGVNSMWNNHKIDDVATLQGWAKDPAKVLEFYNERRKQLPDVNPNEAHKALALLEENFDVIHVTQNVSDLLERAGATNVLHLHGELTKARGVAHTKFAPAEEIVDIGYDDIKIDDKCPHTNTQLRPNIVWFSEFPFHVVEAYDAIMKADILLIVGTSLQITYTIDMLNNTRQVGDNPCKIFYIDPAPSHELDYYGTPITYIEKSAVEGVTEIVEKIMSREI